MPAMMPLTNDTHMRRLSSRLLILSVSFFLGGVLLSTLPLNQEWMVILNHMVTGADPFWSFLTQFGEGGAALLLLLVFTRFSPNGTALSLKCFLIGSLASPLLKSWFSHPRPLGVLEPGLIHTIGLPATAANAMPSGHSMTVVAAVTLLGLCLPSGGKYKIIFWAMALFGAAVALSRIMVGAHWPSDVIAGAGLGWLVVALAHEWEMRQAWEPRLRTRVAQYVLLLAETGLVIYLFLASTHTPSERLAFDLMATVGIAGALSRLSKLRQVSAP
jgi:membrane-associated phospholipid phosphatase